MAEAATITDTPVRPLLWTKRIGVLCALAASLVVATRYAWQWRVDRQRAALDAALVAAGGKARIEDYNLAEPVPDDENVVKLIDDANALLDPTAECPANSNIEWDPRRVPYEPLWFQYANNAYAKNRPAIELLKSLPTRSRADWGVRFSPGAFAPTGRFNTLRKLANEVADAALLQHYQGNDAEAFALFEVGFDLADVTRTSPGTMPFLVGGGIDALTVSRVMVALSATHVGPDRGVPRERVEALLQRLVKDAAEATSDSTLRDPILFDARQLLDAPAAAAPSGWLTRPGRDRAVIKVSQRMLDVAKAARSPDARRLAIPPSVLAVGKPPIEDIWVRFIGGDWTHRIADTSNRVTLERRFAAIALAVLLYRHDHNGAYPTSLDALVPKYLPAVPADPLSRAVVPIQLRMEKTPDGSPRPMLFAPANSTEPRPYPHLNFDWQSDDGTNRSRSRQDNIGQWRDLSRWADATPGWRGLSLVEPASPWMSGVRQSLGLNSDERPAFVMPEDEILAKMRAEAAAAASQPTTSPTPPAAP